MTAEIPTCPICNDRPLVTRANGALRRGAKTCGDHECQKEHRNKYLVAEYRANPERRARMAKIRALNEPSVKNQVLTLMKEICADPCIPKVGAVKTIATYLYGEDRFRNITTVRRQARARNGQ